METLAYRTFMGKKMRNQYKQSVLSPYHRTGGSVGEFYKSGVTLGLGHIYLISLFDLYALHYGSLFGLSLILHLDMGHLLGK